VAVCRDDLGDQPYSEARWLLVEPHRRRLLGIAMRRVASVQDAEDCVQETLMRAAGFPDLDQDRVGQFLTTTLRRLCVDVHRATARHTRMAARVPLPGALPAPEDTVCDASEGSWFLAQARTLPGRQRDVLLARAAGLTTREAAAHLAISGGAAERAFTYARRRMLAAAAAEHHRTVHRP
jgi:RNA polymerase sigma factor (sigma-70 family)